jgi:RNA polymerase sigma factor (sigma-70 family)
MNFARYEAALFRVGTTSGLSDGELLARFLDRRDSGSEMAFEAIIARHGPMVLAACRRQLGDPDDAADAFQATFLTLARKARSIRDVQSLGGWLHRVARHASGRARLRSARRVEVEHASARGGDSPADSPPSKVELDELRGVLDEELGRLPRSFRAPLVLCYLEGLTHDEAAEQLACPVGTVRSRLARGRDRLRSRLIRRGLAPTSCTLAEGLGGSPVRSAIPVFLVDLTVKAASQVATGRAVAVGSAAAYSLMEGVFRAMFLGKLRVACAALVAIAVLTEVEVARLATTPPKPVQPTVPVVLQEPRAAARAELAGGWDDLKGYWDVVSVQDSGKTLDPKEAHFSECVVLPHLTQPGYQPTTPGTIFPGDDIPQLERWIVERIDPVASPKTIVLQSHAPSLTTAEKTLEKKQLFHHSGIYRVTANELTICLNRGAIETPPPPTKMASEAATGTMLLTFKRRPPDDLRDLRRRSIQGSWEVVSVEPPGPQPLSPKPGQTWVVGPDSIHWKEGDRLVTQLTYPRDYQRIAYRELVMNEPEVGDFFYQHWTQDRGTTLRFCYGKESPAGQSGDPSPGAVLVVLKRLTDPPASVMKPTYEMPTELTSSLGRYRWATGVLPPPLRFLPVPIRR